MIEQLLNVFWLRPETALWRCLDIRAMREFEFVSPSLDLGCGDGIFSFIRAGGEFDPEFDAFKSVGNLDKFLDKADVFDNYDTEIHPGIRTKPRYTIDCGLDHKENLLKKADTLGLYKEVVRADANKMLPFADNAFETIFSNIIYWLDRPKEVLCEIYRILRPGGRLCVMLPNNTLRKYSFYCSLVLDQDKKHYSFLESLDRGRVSNYRHALSSSEWAQSIEQAGFRVVRHEMHLSKTVVQLWDIGLRPLFPVLRRMVDCLNQGDLSDIKKDWMATFMHYFVPLLKAEELAEYDDEPAFHCYVLGK